MRVGQICRDCESEISRILLMVDLRVVDISGFDVILDMDELTTHRVVSDCDRRWVIIPDTILELCRVTYACDLMRMCVEFRDEILLKGEECKTWEN